MFVRTISAHRGNLTDLLHDPAALHTAVDGLVTQGYPLADLMVVEFRAEPIHGDTYRKLNVYRVGEQLVTAPSVHERSWTAKYGEKHRRWTAALAEVRTACRPGATGAQLLEPLRATSVDPTHSAVYTVGLGHEGPIAAEWLEPAALDRQRVAAGSVLGVRMLVPDAEHGYLAEVLVLVTSDDTEMITTLGYGPISS